MRLNVRWRDVLLACSSAPLLLLSFPKFDFGALAWVGLVPLLVCLDGKSAGQAYGLSFVAGLAFFAGLFYWIWYVPDYRVIDEILLGLYLPQYFALWGLALGWIRRRTTLPATMVAPPLWVAFEYVRSNLSFLSLPWMLLGHSQYRYPPLIQVTSLTGVYGLSFLIVLVNAALAEAIISTRQRAAPARALATGFRRVPFPSLIIAASFLLATSLYGLFVLSKDAPEERIRVAVVQGNIPQQQKWDRASRPAILERHATLTRDAARHAPLLIIWPETAVPGDVLHHPDLKKAVAQVAIDTKTPLLVGSAEQAKFVDRKLVGKYYNAMFLFTPAGNLDGQYRKIALIPFGEFEPLRGIIAWPKAVVAAAGSYVPGDQFTLFTVGPVTFSAIICWETIFPDLFREFVKRGARLMINGTNEAWFHDTAVPYQLLAMSVFRAAENRVAVVRAANTGISAFIDPLGRITKRLRGPNHEELFVTGVLVGEVPLAKEKTFYTQYGDVFALLALAGATALILYGLLRAVPRVRISAPP